MGVSDPALRLDRRRTGRDLPATPTAGAAASPWLVIRNPAAGDGGAERGWRRFERALRSAGVALQTVTTTAPGDATRIAQEAMADGFGQLMVAGGDGTAHEVVNGLMLARERSAALVRAPLVVPVPLGTGNDWARSLGLARDAAGFAAVVADRHVVAGHDVGRMRFDATTATPSRWFVNVAGAGFDAQVIAGMGARASSRFGYLVQALRALDRYRSPDFRIESATHGAVVGRFLLAFVTIGRYCGHRMQVAPTAVADDGLFDLVTIDEVNLVRALPKLAKLYRGTLLGDPLVRHLRAPRLHVRSAPSAPVEADGQLVGATPVTFEVETRALRVLRPRDASAASS